MFGEGHKPPRPSRWEPYVLLLIAVLIALMGTVGYAVFMFFAERTDQPF